MSEDVSKPATNRPVAPWVPALIVIAAFGAAVAAIASQFVFDPVGRQIAWIGSSFTLTAGCVAYVVQESRRRAWEEAAYDAAVREAKRRTPQ